MLDVAFPIRHFAWRERVQRLAPPLALCIQDDGRIGPVKRAFLFIRNRWSR